MLGFSLPALAARRLGGPDLPTPAALMMGVRGNQMGYNGMAGSDGADTDSNTRIAEVNQTGADVTRLIAYFAGWRANTTNEQDGYNPVTISASVEYPAGVFTPLTFGGAASYVLGAGETKGSDEAVVTIPAGAQFWLRTYVAVAAGQKWVQGYVINTARGEAADFSTGVDKTLGGTIANATPTSARRGFGPIGVKATAFSGTPLKRAFASLGDSVLMASGDGNVDARGATGWNGRAFSSAFPHVNFAIAGTAAAWNQPIYLARRLAALQAMGVTDILCDYGNNDCGGASSAATITGYVAVLAAGLKAAGFRVHYCTLVPWTSSSDGWKTAANQTPVNTNSFQAKNPLVSDFIRANSFSADGIVEIGDLVSVDDNNALTRNGPKWLSGNGGVGAANIHLTTSGAANDAATSDGRHPNLTHSGSLYGGHYVLKDALTAYLASLPA